MNTSALLVRCLPAADEPLAHQILTRFIAQVPGLTLSGQYRHALEAHEQLR